MNNDTPANAMQLKPCPFCGGEAQRFTLTEEDEPMNAGGDVITCTKCQASSHVEFGRKENLVSRWNTRTPSLAAQDGLVCTGCGSTQSIEQIRAEKPSAFSCCPERKMVPQSKASQVRLVEALEVIAVGEGCMNGIREELSAEALRKIARAALASIEVKS